MVKAMLLNYRYRLSPTRAQHARLRAALDHTRDLYNAALEERIEAYRKQKKIVGLFDQTRGLSELRSDPLWAHYASPMQRWPLKQVDLAFKAFFKRLKSGTTKLGFPRFRGFNRFKTFGFTDRAGWKVSDGRLYIKGIGRIRLHLHRAIPLEPLALKIKRVGKHWFALLTVSVSTGAPHIGGPVGVDMGVTHLATLSNGEHISNPRHGARLAARVRRAQRAMARCKRGSRNQNKAKARVAALREREADARSTYLHQVSADLAKRFGTIVVEKLSLINMTRSAKGTIECPGKNVAQKAGLNRAVRDAAFGRFREMLRYKAERAGGELIEVDPRNTSRTCSECGVIDAKSRRSQSAFICTGCGHSVNADHNAAINIARLGGVAIPDALNLRVA